MAEFTDAVIIRGQHDAHAAGAHLCVQFIILRLETNPRGDVVGFKDMVQIPGEDAVLVVEHDKWDIPDDREGFMGLQFLFQFLLFLSVGLGEQFL